MRILLIVLMFSQTLAAQSVSEIRGSVTRALPILQRSASAFIAKRACVSCHHNILPILTFHLAQSRGFTIDSAVLSAVEAKTFRQLRNPNTVDDAVQAATLNDPTPDDSYLLMAAHAAGLEADLSTAVYARRLARWQRDGHWVTSDFRPPHSSSLFTATATAVRAISLYMPEELSLERDASLHDARQWLFDSSPASTEDAAFRLMGLVWARGSSDEIAAAQRDLLALQKPDGGWSELPGYEPDAYSTGESLYALRESGVQTDGSPWQKALKFLISTQARDGSWRVRTRMISPAEVSPPYFATGFPYGKDEFLSYAGTSWAVMALVRALPEAEPAGKPAASKASNQPAINPPPGSQWIRTALFGTPGQLAALLDAGLDPNSKTKTGTTLLMMAAPDGEKVRLLLTRGADPTVRAASGCDALSIAAAYRGTAASLAFLLNAGGEAEPPPGVKVRKTPLVLASMTGDLENVKLLLARGAPADSDGPLSMALTFGYPDVVQALVSSGAGVQGVESTGINLLHWVVITNHPAIIPILVQAGVPINATDDFGFTPLMYASTIDFGDARAVKELLKAGADPAIRNGEGRTPLEQARHYKHALLEAALQ